MSQSLAGLDIEALRETINASSQEIGRATDVLEAAEVAQNPSLSMLLTLGLVLLLIFFVTKKGGGKSVPFNSLILNCSVSFLGLYFI